MKVMVVDDSPVYRMILKSVFRSHENIENVVTAPDGKLALQLLKREEVDLVVTDLEMPNMNGVELMKALKKEHPKIPYLIISSLDSRTTEMGMDALQQGALDFIQKPADIENDSKKARDFFEKSVERFLKGFHQDRFDSAPVQSVAAPPKPAVKASTFTKPNAVFIGISTGGPRALTELIPRLKGDLKVPVVIVLHIPAGFSSLLAERLNNLSSLTVEEAQAGMKLKARHVYLAQGGRHLVMKKAGAEFSLDLADFAPVHGCRPSVDVFFQSAHDQGFQSALTCILTGMGVDGKRGVELLKTKGAYSLIQDKESSVVWGMPGAVYNAGLHDEVLSLDKLSDRINELGS